jgi:stage III sporulation protein SpoIIIAA
VSQSDANSSKCFHRCREIARILADEGKKRVVIVDTSNEIGGDGDVPHSGIGRSRRMQVPKVTMQHNVCS